METQERKLRTNLDTDLLKLVAIAAMLLDMQERENTNLPLLTEQLKETQRGIDNLLNAIQQGIFTKSTKSRLDELEAAKEELEIKIVNEKIAKPKLTEEQIRKVMNVISDDGALTILKIRTYDKSFEDAVAVSAVPEVTAKFQEDIETYQLHDYFIRGKNRAGAGSDYIYRKMMYEWFGEPYVVKYLMEY